MNGSSSETWNMSSDGRVRLHRVQEETSSYDDLLTLPKDTSGSHRERSPTRQLGFHRKHRSLSTPKPSSSSSRTTGATAPSSAKPKKARRNYLGTASTSLTSIPNAIKLSMLNSGLLSVGEHHQSRWWRLKLPGCPAGSDIRAAGLRVTSDPAE